MSIKENGQRQDIKRLILNYSTVPITFSDLYSRLEDYGFSPSSTEDQYLIKAEVTRLEVNKEVAVATTPGRTTSPYKIQARAPHPHQLPLIKEK